MEFAGREWIPVGLDPTFRALLSPVRGSALRDRPMDGTRLRLVSLAAERRFLVLFLAIVINWFGTSLLEEPTAGKALLTSLTVLMLLAALLSVLLAVTKNRRRRYFALSFGASAVVATTFDESMGIASLILSTAFLIFVAVEILSSVLAAERVTFEVINGALCVYLLLGIIASAVYSLVESLHPGSFTMPTAHASPKELRRALLYFSYVTQTTVGYGDIAPVTALSRSLVNIHAIAGQLYLAVLVARLVALEIVHRERR